LPATTGKTDDFVRVTFLIGRRKGEGSNLKHLSPEQVELTNGSPSMLNSILYAVSQRGIQIMRRQFKFYQLSVLALLLLLALTNFSISKAQDKKKNEQVRREGTPVMWREPSDIATRDLFLGSGGETLKPDLSRITLIEKEKGGWSTKYRVRDGSGREWVAKIGEEAQPETAAVRLMWGVGFFADIDYLVPSVRIEGLDKTLENVRFGARPKEIKRVGSWQWSNNPFTGKREFQGLKIMMAILDNWDIKDDNNTILAVRNDNGENELRYVVHDLGATFGKSSGAIWQKTRSRNDPKGYAKANFIDEVKNDRVDFHYHSKLNKLFDDITVEDAKWMAHWLSQLSDRQIEDAFRAANYSSEDVKLLAGAFRERIKELVALKKS